jgi:hypothetical protein
VYPTDAVNRLIEAALDQPKPTIELTLALQDVLIHRKHPDRDLARDPKRGRREAQ